LLGSYRGDIFETKNRRIRPQGALKKERKSDAPAYLPSQGGSGSWQFFVAGVGVLAFFGKYEISPLFPRGVLSPSSVYTNGNDKNQKRGKQETRGGGSDVHWPQRQKKSSYLLYLYFFILLSIF
jgi:hypothetical protein